MFISSFSLGIASWILAILAIVKNRKYILFIFSSFTCCCVSTVLQFGEIQRRSSIGDFTGIDDTIGTIIFLVSAIITVNLILNFIALTVSKKNR